MKKAVRGSSWNAQMLESPIAGGYIIEKVDPSSPASRVLNSGRLRMTDIVVRIDNEHLVGAQGGLSKMQDANKYSGNVQTLDVWVWRANEE